MGLKSAGQKRTPANNRGNRPGQQEEVGPTWKRKMSTCQQCSPSNNQQHPEKEEPANTWRAQWQRHGPDGEI